MQFVLTSYGAEILATGAPTILSYKVGSGSGYTPSSASTDITGTLLESGTTYAVSTGSLGPTYLIIIIANPDQPLSTLPMGEVGLYYTNRLVALAVVENPFYLSSISTTTISCALPNVGANAAFAVLSSSQLGNLALIPSVDVLPFAAFSGGNNQFAIHGASILAYADNNAWLLVGSAYLVGGVHSVVSGESSSLTLEVDLTAYNSDNKYYVTVVTGGNAGLARTATFDVSSEPGLSTLTFNLTWNTVFETGDLVYLYSSTPEPPESIGIIAGPAGPIGPQGFPGTQGPQGIPGDTGSQGTAGLDGPQGIPGATGPQGTTGAQGIQGIQGIPGPLGTAPYEIQFSIVGTLKQNTIVGVTKLTREVVIPAAFLGSKAETLTFPITGNASFNLSSAGLGQICEVRFIPNSFAGSFIPVSASQVILPIDTMLVVTTSSIFDATIKNLSISIAGRASVEP